MTAASGLSREHEARGRHDVWISWHSRCTDIDSTAWKRLFGAPTLGLFWFKALEAGTGQQFKFWYGQIRSGVTTVGIVPAFLFDLPLEIILPQRERKVLAWFARGPLRRARYVGLPFYSRCRQEEGKRAWRILAGLEGFPGRRRDGARWIDSGAVRFPCSIVSRHRHSSSWQWVRCVPGRSEGLSQIQDPTETLGRRSHRSRDYQDSRPSGRRRIERAVSLISTDLRARDHQIRVADPGFFSRNCGGGGIDVHCAERPIHG